VTATTLAAYQEPHFMQTVTSTRMRNIQIVRGCSNVSRWQLSIAGPVYRAFRVSQCEIRYPE